LVCPLKSGRRHQQNLEFGRYARTKKKTGENLMAEVKSRDTITPELGILRVANERGEENSNVLRCGGGKGVGFKNRENWTGMRGEIHLLDKHAKLQQKNREGSWVSPI